MPIGFLLQTLNDDGSSDQSMLPASSRNIIDARKTVEATGFEGTLRYFNVCAEPRALVQARATMFMAPAALHVESRHQEIAAPR